MKFTIDEKDQYTINFEVKEAYFIYNLELKLKKNVGFAQKEIKQDIIDYCEKMNYFKESLIDSKEENKLDDLFYDSIDVYSKKPKFEFLINLFIQVYEKKDLCSKLLTEFIKTYDKPDQKIILSLIT